MISDVTERGTGMLAMFVDLDDEWHKEFRTWLQEDMFTARLNLGFHACASYDLITDMNTIRTHSRSFLTVYETASLGVLYSEPYQDLRRERDRKDADFHARFLSVERYTLNWVGPELAWQTPGFAPFVYVDRFDLISGKAQKFNQWFVNEYMPACQEMNFPMRLRRYTAIEGIPRIFLLHEFDDLSVIKDTGWNTLRRNRAWEDVTSYGGGFAAYKRIIFAP